MLDRDLLDTWENAIANHEKGLSKASDRLALEIETAQGLVHIGSMIEDLYEERADGVDWCLEDLFLFDVMFFIELHLATLSFSGDLRQRASGAKLDAGVLILSTLRDVADELLVEDPDACSAPSLGPL